MTPHGTYEISAKEPLEEFLTLLHLTDLHFAAETSVESPKNAALVHLERHLAGEKIDLVVVTGDLVDNNAVLGDSATHEQVLGKAKRYLVGLSEDLDLQDRERLVVVPGNHDYRWQGALHQTQGQATFGRVFGEYFQHRLYRWGDKRMLLAAFDSLSNRGAYEFATGYVDPLQFAALDEMLEKQELNGLTEIKLALVHHHPLPVAGSEQFHLRGLERLLGKKLVGAQEMLLLKNSASFLRHLLDSGFGLVLHGHMHEPEYWRIHSPSTTGSDRWVEVIGGGAFGVNDESRGHRYSIVRVFKDGRIEGCHKGFDAQGTALQPIVIPCAPHEVVRLKDAVESPTHSHVSCQVFSQIWDVDLLRGSAKSIKELKNLAASSGYRISRIELPTVGHKLVPWLVEPRSMGDDFHVKYEPQSELQKGSESVRVRHWLSFRPELSAHAVRGIVCRCSYESVLFRSQEDQEHFGSELSEIGWDGISQPVLWPCEHLLARVRFGGGFAPQVVTADICDQSGKASAYESESEHVCVHYWSEVKLDPSGKGESVPEATLCVYRPKCGFSYGIKWELPKQDPVPPDLRAQIQAVRHELLNLASSPDMRALADNYASDARDAFMGVVRSTNRWGHLNAKSLHAYFFAFDSNRHALSCRGSTTGPEDLLVKRLLPYGRDIVGAAFREQQPLYFSRRNREQSSHITENDRFFAQLPSEVRYVFACPLYWEAKKTWPVGVIALAATDEPSILQAFSDQSVFRAAHDLFGVKWEQIRNSLVGAVTH